MSLKIKKALAEKIKQNKSSLEQWYESKAAEAALPFYCSIDLRDAGFKIAPVDSNLYPAGFNNICPEDLRVAPQLIRDQIHRLAGKPGFPASIQKLAILPEKNTQNLYYLENLHTLSHLLEEAGFEVRIGWYDESSLRSEASESLELTSQSGKPIRATPLTLSKNRALLGNFDPDLIILNNDFSSGHPEPLDSIEQPIIPSHVLGWHSRKKSAHFLHYNRLAGEFSQLIGIDPWLLQVETEEVTPVNFNEEQGLERVAESVSKILARTQAAYQERKIQTKPFVFVKNNAGTYGMGILVAHSAEELLSLNRREKNKMSVGKNRSKIESVVVQEGIPTSTLVDRLAAEPVIYLFGNELAGGFLRTNTQRGVEDNLNSQGMVFKKLCMSDLKREDEEKLPLLELVYGTIARISALAAGYELLEARIKRDYS